MAEKTFELVTYEKSNRIAWITIRNESRMNALSTGVLNGLYDSFEEVDNDDDVLIFCRDVIFPRIKTIFAERGEKLIIRTVPIRA